MNETGKNYLRSNNWWRVNILLDYCWTFGLQLSGYFTDFKKIRFIFLDFKKNRFDAVFLYDSCEDLALCFPVTVNVIREVRKSPNSLNQQKVSKKFWSVIRRFLISMILTFSTSHQVFCRIRRRDNAISTHQKILTIYSLQDDKTHSNYVNTGNKNLIIQPYRSTSLKFLFVLCS